MQYNMLKKAQEIINEYYIETFPVDIEIIEQIMTEMGYKIKYFESCDKSCVVGNVVINGRKESVNQLRQSMAHELGHIVTHITNQMENGYVLKVKEEAQADAFAMYFLMPEMVLKEIIDEYEDLYGLCEYFGVEYSFCKQRVKLYNKTNKIRR